VGVFLVFENTNNHFLIACSTGGGEADNQPLRNANAADVDMETFNAAPEGNVA
jgi:hypothetical protein